MAKYPIFLELKGRRVVLIGAGTIAFRKATTLLEAGARLVIVAEHATPEVELLCQQNKHAELVKSSYAKEYLNGAIMVIAATNNRQLNKQIYRDCQNCGAICNVVDDPELCDFFAPAVLRRGDLQIAISTEGACPAYAGHIRKKLEDMFTDTHAKFLSELECLRAKVISELPGAEERKTVMGKLSDDASFEIFTASGPDKWRWYADELIAQYKGKRA